MILTGKEIYKLVQQNKIHIKPFLKENINPNSYNYRLGDKLLEIIDEELDAKKPCSYKKIKLTEEGYTLLPGKLYLGSTVEEIGSDEYVTQLIGRSSIGRLGLFLQITAPLGQLGAKHCWTLELHTVQPLKVYPNMKIGQVSFWGIKGERSIVYKGAYGQFSKPHISVFYNKI